MSRWKYQDRGASGRVFVESFESDLLKSNPLGDPYVRDLPVYLPPSYDNNSKEYPVVICMSGFTGGAWNWFNFQPWMPTMDERMSQLLAEGVPEMVLVFPDCFTRYGGSQYLDSIAVGSYSSYITQEIIPFLEDKFRVKKDRRYRGVMGKSSGGFGALTMALQHPDLFSAFACHSGDMYFEYCYFPDFPPAIRVLEQSGGLHAFLQNFDAFPKHGKDAHPVLNTIAMSACYSPNPQSKPHLFDLPFDESTGEIRDEIWKMWKQKDPVEIARVKGHVLRDFGMVYFDCGKRDEFGLNLGARILAAELRKQHIPHEYQEFEGGHFNIQDRYDVSLRKFGEYFTAVSGGRTEKK